MDRARWLQEKHDEIRQLHGLPLSEITPSRRDFALYVATQRRELAVIARVPPRPRHDSAAFAAACDAAEVAAIAVATDAQRGGSLALLRTVADCTQAPILRDDLTLDPLQLYAARLHGADAVVLPAAELDAATLGELTRIAASLHMTSVVEVQSLADLAKALALSKVLIGLNAEGEPLRQLADAVPAHVATIGLREPPDAAAARALRGVVDALVLGALLWGSPDLEGTLAGMNA